MTRLHTLAALLLLAGCPSDEDPTDDTDTDDGSDTDDTDTDGGSDTDTDTDAQGVRTPVRARVGRRWGCDDPTLRASEGPLTDPLTAGDWGSQPFDPDNEVLYVGGGIAAGDLDGDERIDLLLPDVDGPRLYLQGRQGGFTEAVGAFPTGGDHANLLALADIDGDADLDVFVGRHKRADRLWRNDGGTFVDITDAAGVAGDASGRTNAATFWDLDRDGDLDLLTGGFGPFVAEPRPPGERSRVYLNDGTGSFTEDTSALPSAVHDGYTFVAGLTYLDDDRWPELIFVNDFGDSYPSELLWGSDEGFVLDDGSAGFRQRIQGMGLGFADWNGDGVDDVVMAGWGNNRLLLSGSGNLWSDAHEAWGLDGDRKRGQVIGWATETADLDHDGDLDVIEGFGHIHSQSTPEVQPDEIFLHEGGIFTAAGASWGFDHGGQTRGVLAVDVNGDGWLDLVRNELTGPATYQQSRCDDSRSAIIRLRDFTEPNTFGVGAKVIVEVGAKTYTRVVRAGGTSVLAHGPPEVHVGLGAVDRIDRIEVQWPTGRASAFTDLRAGAPITVERGDP